MLTVSKQILFQNLGDESVILHLNSEEYFGLDSIGTRIWEVLTEQGSIDKTVNLLLEEFEVEEAQLRKDVIELVEELKGEKILIDA